jgi:hypothetical protein
MTQIDFTAENAESAEVLATTCTQQIFLVKQAHSTTLRTCFTERFVIVHKVNKVDLRLFSRYLPKQNYKTRISSNFTIKPRKRHPASPRLPVCGFAFAVVNAGAGKAIKNGLPVKLTKTLTIFN